MKTEQMILSQRVDQLCKKKGLSYYMLSYESGVPLSTLMHLINGTVKNPRIDTIIRLCYGFGITMAEFFDIEDFEILVKAVGEE